MDGPQSISEPAQTKQPTNLKDSFGSDYDQAVLTVRRALTDLVTAAGGDATRPQELSRSFRLDKNLTWKVSRLIHTEDPAVALRFLPGPGGLKILDEGLGVPAGEASRTAFQHSVRGFDAMVRRHAGDRATLEMMVQGLDHTRRAGAITEVQSLQRVRRDAFRGNAAVWGVQAAAQFGITAVVPNAENSDFADVLKMEGLAGFRRTRNDTRWRLFSRQSWYHDRNTPFPAGGRALVESQSGPDQAPLVPEFCSHPLPAIDVLRSDDWTRYELPPGPVGNTHVETIVYGVQIERLGGVRTDDPDAACELGIQCATPTEFLQMDLLLHRGLGWDAPSNVRLTGTLDGRSPFHADSREERGLPLESRIELMGQGIDRLASDRFPRHADMTKFMLSAGGWDPAEFDAYRVALQHPPVPTALILATRLPLA